MIGLTGLAVAPAHAQADCSRGDLDERFCDENGDLVADTPTDPSQWVDPDTIIFAYTPVEDPAVYGVANKDYEVASIANSVKQRMIERGVISEEDTKVIYTSQTFPTTGFGYAYNLAPDLQAKIRESFENFQWFKPDGSKTTLQIEFEKSDEGQFIPITYQEEWAVIRKIDAANDVSYACK